MRPSTMTCIWLALLCGVASWWLGEYANAVAWRQTETNIELFTDGRVAAKSAGELLIESLKKTARDPIFLSLLLMAYGAPALAMGILHRHPISRLALLSVLVALFAWDLVVAAAPSGGDRKGCVNCDLPAFAHLAVGFLIVPSALLIAALGWVRRRFKQR